MPSNLNYKLLRFEKSKRKYKKYTAILQHKKNQRLKKVHFGDIRYQHYRDKTPLKIYSKLDHLDKKRRMNFRSRFRKSATRIFSPAYFAMNYLW
jgi:hypothetical protein